MVVEDVVAATASEEAIWPLPSAWILVDLWSVDSAVAAAEDHDVLLAVYSSMVRKL